MLPKSWLCGCIIGYSLSMATFFVLLEGFDLWRGSGFLLPRPPKRTAELAQNRRVTKYTPIPPVRALDEQTVSPTKYPTQTASPTKYPTQTASPTKYPTRLPTIETEAALQRPAALATIADRTDGPGPTVGGRAPTCVVPVVKRPKDTSTSLSSCSLTSFRGGFSWEDGCRNHCCAECAIQLPLMFDSPQALRFRQKVLDSDTKTLTMVTIGNSVARENGYQTMKSFQQTMQAQYPDIEWQTELNRGITGGSSQQTMYRTLSSKKAKDFHGADVIVIQYSQFAHCEQCIYAEELLRVLLSMESQPLVILVEHVTRAAFDPDISEADTKFYVNNVSLWEEISASERGLAAHYNLPFVSMSAAVKTFAMNEASTKKTFLDELPHKAEHSTCLAQKLHGKLQSSLRSMNAKEILSKFYNDHLHFSPAGNAMAGCLLADAATSIIQSTASTATGSRVAKLPGPFLADTKRRMGALSKSVTAFVNSTHHNSLFSQLLNTSIEVADKETGNLGDSYLKHFRFRQGGRGGKKVWLHTTAPGAVIMFVTPKPCTMLQLEMYKHHELPMGSAEVRIDGVLVKTLDACCPKTCVDNGDGIKRGWYYVETLAEKLENKIHEIEIKVITKTATQCELLGNQFDVTSVIGSIST